MASITTLLSTPRGMIYAVLTVLLLLGWATGLGLVKWVAVAFLLYTIALSAMEQFSCLKCWLGLSAAIMVVLTAFSVVSPRFYILAFIFMWGDAWLHAAG